MASQKETRKYSNHPFSGANLLLVSGRVYVGSTQHLPQDAIVANEGLGLDYLPIYPKMVPVIPDGDEESASCLEDHPS